MKRLTLDKETLRTLDPHLAGTVVGGTVWPPPTEGTSCSYQQTEYCPGSGSGGGGVTSRTKPCPM